jgi:hypothetical protein
MFRPWPADGHCPPRVRALLCACGLGLVPSAAGAEQVLAPTQAEPVVIVVAPTSGCVTAREFLDQVRRRTPRARDAAPGEAARRFGVAIEDGVRVVGKLFVENADGTAAVREVQGTSCQEVADALALVVAVTLDPLADQSPAARANDRAYRPRSAPPSSRSPVPLPPPGTAHAPGAPEPTAHWEHALGGEAVLKAWLVDKPMAGLGARYWGSRTTDTSVGPLLTLGAFTTFDANAEADRRGGVIRYNLSVLEAGVCPLGARLGARVHLYPCAALTVGQLVAKPTTLPGAEDLHKDSVLFFEAALQARWILRLAGPLGLAGAAGLSVPVRTYSVEVEGNEQPVDSTNGVGFAGSLGLALIAR